MLHIITSLHLGKEFLISFTIVLVQCGHMYSFPSKAFDLVCFNYNKSIHLLLDKGKTYERHMKGKQYLTVGVGEETVFRADQRLNSEELKTKIMLQFKIHKMCSTFEWSCEFLLVARSVQLGFTLIRTKVPAAIRTQLSESSHLRDNFSILLTESN